ncbi:MAG: HU family DNA-binding protein [Erysipelotrichaceae bacterium]
MSESLNKKALADIVSEKLGITKKDAAVAVDTVFEEITSTLKEQGKVDISGFGKFEVKTRAARIGINPSTKEKMEIAESKAPGFKAAKALKDAVK